MQDRARQKAFPDPLGLTREGGPAVGDKQNPREADVIVAEIKKLVSDPTLARVEAENRWRSIGAISLIGGKQAALINRKPRK